VGVNIDDRFEQFLGNIPIKMLSERIARQSKFDVDLIVKTLQIFINEARTALLTVRPYLAPGISILEIGAGLCLCSLFLKKEKYNVVALEPSTAGYGMFRISKNVITNYYKSINLTVLEKKASKLNREDGNFDLIFSNNVIEHIPDIENTLSTLAYALAPGGRMVHACPNYIIPYEPHFQIFVIKFWPGLSKFLYSRKICSNVDLWNSLNFITFFYVRKFARAKNLKLTFKRGLLYEAFERLDSDAIYRERQSGGGVLLVYKILKVTGLFYTLRYLHPALSTPMIFELKLPK
jgi:2-polyprenyl-3-methyl-5-hydroxy-6-metoxy-1,4-benzoquinol methylase